MFMLHKTPTNEHIILYSNLYVYFILYSTHSAHINPVMPDTLNNSSQNLIKK